MSDQEPVATQRAQSPVTKAELEAKGFAEPRIVGRGGFGVVYRCREAALDRVVAVKVLTGTDDADPDNLERFLREQQAMGRMSGHPNIVQVLQVGTTTANHPFIVMPYHSEGSLERRIRDNGPLPLADALHIMVKLSGALETIHRTGILHRDVKPANILLTDYDEPQLTDFGIARIEGGFQTSADVVLGSPAFTAPEVLQEGAASVASDIYGLGATLFCAITGHAAFERRTGEGVVAQFLRIAAEPIPDLRSDGIPNDLCAAIEASMARNPVARPHSAEEFGDRMRTIQRNHGLLVDDMVLRAPPTTDPRQARRFDTFLAESPNASHPRPSLSRLSTPPAAATKFRPALQTRTVIPRPRLLEALQSDRRPRLIVIHAPAGFGKSTLAAQWAEQLRQQNVVVAWLNADRDDNNATWFLGHILEAIHRTHPGLTADLAAALEEHGRSAERYVSTTLIDTIHESGDRVVVVIDDAHRITDSGSLAVLSFLIDHGCHHLQILVTSRSQMHFPMSTLRVREEVIEIDSAALRFDPTEARDLLVDIGGLPLSPGDIAGLHQCTDGWAAGLQLASLSLRGHDDPTALVGHLTGRHHAISAYLTENVLENLDPDLVDALLATSITELICSDLATVLTGHRRGQVLLEDIEHRDLFLRRIDDDGRWFRYHHLFAEYLRQRLERDHPEWIRELHRAAAEWFGRHHLLSEAIDHALTAELPERAVELVEADALDLVQHSQLATLIGLAEKLPSSSAATHPKLQIALAWAFMMLRQRTEMETALHLALPAESSRRQPSSTIAVEAAIIRSVQNLLDDRVGAVDQLVHDCISQSESLSPWVMCAATNVEACAALYNFDFDQVRAWHERAAPYLPHLPGALSPMYSFCLAGLADWEQLNTIAAEHNFRTALKLGRTSAGENPYTATVASALLGNFLYERNQIVEAEQLLDNCEKLGAAGGSADFMLATYGTGARVKALRGDLDSAAVRLTEGARIARVLDLPRLSAGITNEAVRLGLKTIDRRTSSFAVDPADLPHNGIEKLIVELEQDSFIRSVLRDDPPLAIGYATALAESIDSARRPRAALRAALLLTTCYAADHRMPQAKHALSGVLADYAPTGLTRPILDEGSTVRVLIHGLLDDLDHGRWSPDWTPVPRAFLAQLAAVDHTTQ
ncbi:protein kinase domain-containing protein [Nocardia sp. NPDC055053]